MICPYCVSERCLRGKFFNALATKYNRTSPVFTPRGTKAFTWTSSHLPLVKSCKMDACLDCSLIWTECRKERLQKVIARNMKETVGACPNVSCPRCHGSKVVIGSLSRSEKLNFRPAGMRFFTFFKSDLILQDPKSPAIAACVDCGIVFAHIDSDQLRAMITRHGRKRIIQGLKLDMEQSG